MVHVTIHISMDLRGRARGCGGRPLTLHETAVLLTPDDVDKAELGLESLSLPLT